MRDAGRRWSCLDFQVRRPDDTIQIAGFEFSGAVKSGRLPQAELKACHLSTRRLELSIPTFEAEPYSRVRICDRTGGSSRQKLTAMIICIPRPVLKTCCLKIRAPISVEQQLAFGVYTGFTSGIMLPGLPSHGSQS